LTVFEAGVAAQHITPSSFDAIRMGGPRVPFVRGSAGRSRSFAPAKADGKLSAKVSSASERIRESRRREESVDDALSACPAMTGWPQRVQMTFDGYADLRLSAAAAYCAAQTHCRRILEGPLTDVIGRSRRQVECLKMADCRRMSARAKAAELPILAASGEVLRATDLLQQT
jgi:hypothetical protein